LRISRVETLVFVELTENMGVIREFEHLADY
jgi:hypothetical protein